METVTFFTLYEKITIEQFDKGQVLRAFKTGLKDVVEKMSGNGNRPTIFRSRVALEVADMIKPRSLAGAKLFYCKKAFRK